MPPTPTAWSPRISRELPPRRTRSPGPGGRDRARCDLCPDGRWHRARVRRDALDQLRVRAADHGGCVRARVRVGSRLAGRGRDRPLLRGRARPVPRDGEGRLQAAPDAVRCRHAHRDVRDRIPPAVDRAALVRAARQDSNVARAAQSPRGDRRRRDPKDHDRRDRHGRGLSAAARRPAEPNLARAAHARGSDRLADRAAPGRSCEPREHRLRADRRGAGRGRGRHADRAVPDGHAHVRAPGDDPRARGCRRGRHDAAALRHARRVPHRLRVRRPRRSAAVPAEPVPPVARLRVGDPRAARAPGWALLARARPRGAGVKAARAAIELLAPIVLVVAAGVLGAFASQANEIYFVTALIQVSTVVAIYVFVGNSGVLSFGHISFFAVGVWAAGVLSIPEQEKPATMPYLFDFLSSTTVGNVPSLLIAAVAGGLFALLVGLPLMRLSGLAAGIATFAVLGITNNILRYYEKIGPGLNTFSSVPETTDLLQATIGAVLVIAAAFAYQRSRLGRQLRAAREDPPAARAVGVSIYRQRLASFALSGFLAGFAGGLYIHFIPINVDAVYLDLTFITLAMLVIGGTTSLWGAVVGALFVSALDSMLAEMENGMTILGRTIDLPAGSRIVVVSAVMALVLILRPSGLTGGREFSLPRLGTAAAK